LTSIGDAGPVYRGRLATELAARDVPFEAVAELLWMRELPAERPRWQPLGSFPARRVAALLAPEADFAQSMSLAVATIQARKSPAPPSRTLDLLRARSLCLHLAASLSLGQEADRFDAALAAESVALATAIALGAKRPQHAARSIDRALVLCADHELNVSAFAARVAASAGADLFACISAGIAALSGPRHGGVSRKLEAFLASIGGHDRVRAAVHEHLRRGEEVPGFGHPLYPRGDPRAVALLALAREVGGAEPLRTLNALVRAMREERREPPTLDVGLVALSIALDLPPGSAFAMFAVGRAAGWIAHVLEQREDPYLLRPRARYVGDIAAELTSGRSTTPR
jgi:citrate synthase